MLTRSGRQDLSARGIAKRRLATLPGPDRRRKPKVPSSTKLHVRYAPPLSLRYSPLRGGGGGVVVRETEEREEGTTLLLRAVQVHAPMSFPASDLQVSRLGLATRARKEMLQWGGDHARDPRAPTRGCGGRVHMLVAGSLRGKGAAPPAASSLRLVQIGRIDRNFGQVGPKPPANHGPAGWRSSWPR